ncbi:MAG: nucleotidyltransferase family protein [Armatimonadetes bacterium]|nr:nucleotidyltransferase family protein [Armatimonadota bacterium]
MTIEEVRATLAEHRDELSGMGVLSLRVFGSVARGEAGPESDVDFLVELDPARRISLLGYAHILGELEDMLGCRVDLVQSHCLRREFRDEVLREAVHAA